MSQETAPVRSSTANPEPSAPADNLNAPSEPAPTAGNSDAPSEPVPTAGNSDAPSEPAPTAGNSDASSEPPACASSSPKDKSARANRPRFISYVKGFIMAALLGVLAGLLLAYPTYRARTAITNYLDTREQVAKYGEELPKEICTMLQAYHQLHDRFYNELSTYDLLNGALVSLNASISLEKGKATQAQGDKEQTDDAKGADQKKADKDGQTSKQDPSPKKKRSRQLVDAVAPGAAEELAAENDALKAGDKSGDKDNQNESELTLAQAYQKYATVLADSMKNAKVELVYPLLPPEKKNSSDDDLVQQFTVTMLRVLRENKISDEDACYSAISGMAMTTADPYTVAMDIKETRNLNEAMGNENFCGIGAYLEASRDSDQRPTVIEPLEDSPASKAGLLAGDVIIAIDGKPTKGVNLDVAVQRIRGPKGSKVKLTIKRQGKPNFDVVITRDTVVKKSVISKMVGDHAAYIRLRYFGRNTGKDCKYALRDLLEKNAKGIILDLRNNSGGEIIEAVLVASHFLPSGTLITTVSSPRTHGDEDYNSVGSGVPPLPMAVLVNGYSASAAEIVAGALKDSRRSILVGETTFGKGSVQVFNSIGCDMSLKYTIAHYLTPSGHDIHLKGIIPDVECKAPFSNRLGDEDDIQLNEALKQLDLAKKD